MVWHDTGRYMDTYSPSDSCGQSPKQINSSSIMAGISYIFLHIKERISAKTRGRVTELHACMHVMKMMMRVCFIHTLARSRTKYIYVIRTYIQFCMVAPA